MDSDSELEQQPSDISGMSTDMDKDWVPPEPSPQKVYDSRAEAFSKFQVVGGAKQVCSYHSESVTCLA